ncbi:hypothetical protein [Deinococcus peraridilitoris]|uniref:Uncharacterized protein n=1 Tax=Deinococcus peraridilitoris (strain DSM 19664 / LMG 22246 / CIP 109416 / KR-200) TaxID=937777 RepID=K9ZZJ0_DEIPD|nr:hypothetical protein [Deinococcus peraridilitoris]AFZ66357.1 hypothetical protein Deipe_0782 [Deinococcus peraridilitoris DSM 19664]
MSDAELNFAKTLLEGRSYRDLTDDEIIERSRLLLEGWLGGEHRMERPKLYDHYALVLVALLRRVQALETRLEALEPNSDINRENL